MSIQRILDVSAELKGLGTCGISTEAIESLLSEITEAEDRVVLGDDSSWKQLEELRSFWQGKLRKLQAYLAC